MLPVEKVGGGYLTIINAGSATTVSVMFVFVLIGILFLRSTTSPVRRLQRRPLPG